MIRPHVFSVISAFMVLIMAGCATPDATTPTAGDSPLANGLVRRLALADQVAWVKFQNQAPVLDAARESQVIERAVQSATTAGVDPALVTRFFKAQMLASRIRQHELITGWNHGGSLPSWGPVSLQYHIRPVLDQLTGELIDALKTWSDTGHSRQVLASALREAGYSNAVIRAATRF